jgi:hypothetical protein
MTLCVVNTPLRNMRNAQLKIKNQLTQVTKLFMFREIKLDRPGHLAITGHQGAYTRYRFPAWLPVQGSDDSPQNKISNSIWHTIKGSTLVTLREQETSCCLFTKESDVTDVINSLNADDSADSSQFFRNCRNLGNPSRFQGNPSLARVGSCLATGLPKTLGYHNRIVDKASQSAAYRSSDWTLHL